MIGKALKAIARSILPRSTYRRLAFSRIYRKALWGSDGAGFYSGVGSRGEPVRLYVEALAKTLTEPRIIVDLGCGDFTVGRALLDRFPEASYIGCDIVPSLIAHNQRTYGSDRVSFRVLDVVANDIPDGDVHLVRQVFQHLPNADIAAVLDKLKRSPCLIVTEGQPITRSGPVNPDKDAGVETRFDTATGDGAGVELDQPPFSKKIQEICRVRIGQSEQIVTWRVE